MSEYILNVKPNKKQSEFFSATTRYVAYGGARGGGKSWAVRKKATLLCLANPRIRVLIVRRSYGELKENHILALQSDLKGLAVYRESDKAFTFKNGSRLKFGYLDDADDAMQYQGQEYDCVFIDEATQLTELQFQMLDASIRGANDFPKRMYLTCNPGGVGHSYVKRLFITRDYKPFENAADYTFVFANVFDNDALMSHDKAYVSALERLPDNLKRAWLYGDWDIAAGLFFSEFSTERHVVAPFEIDGSYRLYGAMDYGLDALAHYYFAVSECGDVFVIDEVYAKNAIISDAAALILGRGIKCDLELAPHDLFARSEESGKSKATLFAENGVELVKSRSEREAGWLAVKELLRGGKNGSLKIFSTCFQLINSLKNIQTDERNPNDCALHPHELTHAVDALRYFASYYYSRPTAKKFAPTFLRADYLEDYRNATEEERKYLEKKWGGGR